MQKMTIGIDVDAYYNEYSRPRLVFPTLTKEQTDDKLWAYHFRKNLNSDELNKIVSSAFHCQYHSTVALHTHVSSGV
jgi:hypothetical protein